MSDRTGAILLVDDDDDQLARLADAVRRELGDRAVDVGTWKPSAGEDVLSRFDELVVAEATTLVVTDYDLTRNGPAGFFGASIVSWCQQRAIPVGDYSRGNKRNLPKRPNLFEFRFPSVVRQAAADIVAVQAGFADLRARFDDNPNLLSEPSPANMLADILAHEDVVAQLSLYTPQLLANPGLIDLFGEMKDDISERRSLAAYVLGHMLFNSVLRHPGPIIDVRTLCAYLAIDDSEHATVVPLFEDARYTGPFHSMKPRYWRSQVDAALEGFAEHRDADYAGHMASYRRALVELQVGRELPRYPCPRCDGERGGYLCPFTDATVCELGECSVGTSAWIPQGADLSRVERGYYDETAPMLGR